ncbi:MAG: class I SAM-dependent methyltransferase [Dehalococcoidia bacterium]|nr:class I SAM-dependent methyltransferase [Dehalococcoidia bacterium]
MARSNRPGWLLDEMRSIGRENLDPAHVRHYDEKEDAEGAAEVALLRSHGLGSDSTVVDLGAGTGQFALAAAEVCRRVVAVDPSPPMRDLLREQARQRGVGLEVVADGFLTYEHQGEPADLIYSRFALHHLPDFWKAMALGRMRQMLRRGGTLRLWDVVYHFPLPEAEARIEQWCASLPAAPGPAAARTPPEEQSGWTRADIEEHVRDEHSTFTWLLEEMFPRAGFQVREAVYSDDGFFARYLLTAV